MPQHSLISDPNIHEPKGVSTAQPKQLYYTDGMGSGSWQYNPSGWGFYKDSGGSAQTIGTSYSKLTIDGLGSSTEEDFLPYQLRNLGGSLYDSSTNKITPILIGDAYTVRLDLPITAKSGSPTIITIALDIGGTGSPTIVIVEADSATSKTPPYTISRGFPIFCGSTFLANGGEVYLKVDTGSVDVTAPGLFLARVHGEV